MEQRYRLQDAVENPDTSLFRVDRSRAVIARNRFSDVKPWDAARVRLKNPIDGLDYINASPILLTSSGREYGKRSFPPTHPLEKRYIVTQAPLESTIFHFWQMVLQESVGSWATIVMLTRHMEGGEEKCSHYYPVDKDNPTMTVSAPKFEREPGTEELRTPQRDVTASTSSSNTKDNSDKVYLPAEIVLQDSRLNHHRITVSINADWVDNYIDYELVNELGCTISDLDAETKLSDASIKLFRIRGTVELSVYFDNDDTKHSTKFFVAKNLGDFGAVLGRKFAFSMPRQNLGKERELWSNEEIKSTTNAGPDGESDTLPIVPEDGLPMTNLKRQKRRETRREALAEKIRAQSN